MQIHGNRRRCETPHIEERTRGALSRSRTRTTAILDDMPHAAARPALGPSAVIPRVGRDPAPSPRRFGARRRPGPPAHDAFRTYSAQSTFVLPNPAATATNGLPPFIWMGDAWLVNEPFFGYYTLLH